MRILVIDDEIEILERLQQILEQEFYTVETADDGDTGLNKALEENYDLIILDVMLPHRDGFQIIEELRKEKITSPVLMLTAKGAIEDKVEGLNRGADDYLAKPFSIAELLARVRALLRRAKTASALLTAGPITLDTVKREVTCNGSPLALTSKEFSVLEFLLHNKGRAVSRYTLAEHVWGDAFDPFSMSNFIDVHISKLRKKLEKSNDPPIIVTVRGFGYRIERGA